MRLNKKKLKKILIITLSMIMLISLVSCSAKESAETVLNVYNWGDYIDESILEDFENETGIHINYEMFATNEDMYVKLKQGGTKYDIVFPSDYMIERMINENMLHKIDLSKIPNYQYINPKFKGLDYDPGDEYSVPYMWGTVGIVYNKTMVDDVVDSWDILWNEKYKDNILMLDSQRDTMMVALKKLGYSMNTRNLNELEQAKQLLVQQKDIVRAYVGDNVKDLLLAGEAAMAVVWSGEAIAIMFENDNFDYAYPKEGTNLWFDSIVIPKDVQNIDAAHEFIDFLNRPDIAFRNIDYIGYSSPNVEAVKMLDDEIKNMEAAYPSDAKLVDAEIFLDPGDFLSEYNRIWTEIKVQ